MHAHGQCALRAGCCAAAHRSHMHAPFRATACRTRSALTVLGSLKHHIGRVLLGVSAQRPRQQRQQQRWEQRWERHASLGHARPHARSAATCRRLNLSGLFWPAGAALLGLSPPAERSIGRGCTAVRLYDFTNVTLRNASCARGGRSREWRSKPAGGSGMGDAAPRGHATRWSRTAATPAAGRGQRNPTPPGARGYKTAQGHPRDLATHAT